MKIVGVLALLLLASPTALARAAEEQVPIARLRVTLELPERAGALGLFARISQYLRVRTLGAIRPLPGTTLRVTAVAYSSTVSQTDLSPCITAAGTRVQRGTVATNFLPLGTRLRIGDEIFVVLDRMNQRYNGVPIIDIWHTTRRDALTFGKKVLEIEVLDYIPRDQLRNEPLSTRSSPPSLFPASGARKESSQPQGFARRFGLLLRRFGLARLVIPEEADCLTANEGATETRGKEVK